MASIIDTFFCKWSTKLCIPGSLARLNVRLLSSAAHCIMQLTVSMGFLTDTQNFGLHMRQECRERFPHHPGLAIPTCITGRARRTCRDACQGSLISEFLWSRWWRKHFQHSQCMRNWQFCISSERPMGEDVVFDRSRPAEWTVFYIQNFQNESKSVKIIVLVSFAHAPPLQSAHGVAPTGTFLDFPNTLSVAWHRHLTYLKCRHCGLHMAWLPQGPLTPLTHHVPFLVVCTFVFTT